MSHPDFRAGGKIFATLHSDNRHAMVKLTPAQQAQIIADHPGIFAPENGSWGRQGCTRVVLKGASSEAVGEALTLAYQNLKSG